MGPEARDLLRTFSWPGEVLRLELSLLPPQGHLVRVHNRHRDRPNGVHEADLRAPEDLLLPGVEVVEVGPVVEVPEDQPRVVPPEVEVVVGGQPLVGRVDVRD